jgi:hypothetical protein
LPGEDIAGNEVAALAAQQIAQLVLGHGGLNSLGPDAQDRGDFGNAVFGGIIGVQFGWQGPAPADRHGRDVDQRLDLLLLGQVGFARIILLVIEQGLAAVEDSPALALEADGAGPPAPAQGHDGNAEDEGRVFFAVQRFGHGQTPSPRMVRGFNGCCLKPLGRLPRFADILRKTISAASAQWSRPRYCLLPVRLP